MDDVGRLGAVARNGDRLATLRTLRDVLADSMDSSQDARSVAALSRQMTDVLAQIDDLTADADEKPQTKLDELLARRNKAG